MPFTKRNMPFFEWMQPNNLTWHPTEKKKNYKIFDGNFKCNIHSIKAFALPLNFLMGAAFNCALGTTSFLDSKLL